jgi:RimJ/RimL family protein N-acetyltransferase
MSFFLETKRLILRLFHNQDLETLIAYRSDPLVSRYQGWDAPYARHKAVAFVDEMSSKQPGIQGEWYQIAIGLKPEGSIVGDCAFRILPEDVRQAEIGFTLAREHWGQGYACEAVRCLLGYLFDDLALHRVRAICDAENTASKQVLERVGMRQEGYFIENIWFKGKWGSEYSYAILKSEWQAQQSGK